jgi:ribosomal protein L33
MNPVINVEGSSESVDYGDSEINKIYRGLDENIKKEISTYPKKEIQIEILKNIADPELQDFYNRLTTASKKRLDELDIRDKYFMMKEMMKRNKVAKYEEIKQQIPITVRPPEKFSPHSPTEAPPNFSPHSPTETPLSGTKDAPHEIFGQYEDEEVRPASPLPTRTKDISPPQAFDNIVKTFYSLNPHTLNYPRVNYELEVKFGTKGIKPLTKNDYDNIIKTLKSFGFTTKDPAGLSSLRIRCEFLDSRTGRFKMSNVRTEIDGLTTIEKFCKSNDLKTIYKEDTNTIEFIDKKPYINPEKVMIRSVDFNDFNFRVSLQTEERAKVGIENYILENWRKSKKEFRYLNRVTFSHPDYPVNIDISVVKMANKEKDRRGFSRVVPVYTLEESNVLNNPETYEIEIEVNNRMIGPGTLFETPTQIVTAIRKVIKYILGGLQGTMYPVSYPEQEGILRDYMKMIWTEDYDPSKRITSQYFIGPNSITLQITNMAPIDENTLIPNIRKDFVVTDKADGERHLMYVSRDGKIYLITTNMDVKFTGAKTTCEDCFGLLLDGELIYHDKNGKFINLYAAFDIYYYKNKDIRYMPFLNKTQELSDIHNTRHFILHQIITKLNPASIVETHATKEQGMKSLLKSSQKTYIVVSPIKVEIKKFFPISNKQTIFEGCKTILDKEKEGLFEYETDGLIFTQMYYGVGSSVIGKSGPKTKITWEHSFKWKPPQYNTIDFLVTTLKNPNGDDVVKSLFEDGISVSSNVQYSDYKVIELRCGFNEKYDGFINPCQDIIEDNLPEYKPRFEDRNVNDYMPKRFYPTQPYNPNAGLANIILQLDDSGAKQMFSKNGEAFGDNTIVEFAYNLDKEDGWKWEPLRVRYDKTAKLRRGEREFGNSYKVCNENWKSIHPTGRITENMLSTGLGIPDVSVSEDVYYNTPSGKFKTQSLKNFHNLYVKKKLITGASKQGDTLIDFAVGKAGDLPKWIAAKLSFIFGIDYSKDNLENRLDGACVRYLKSHRETKHMPYALFVHGNSAFNIRDGGAMLNDKAKQITAAVFGNGPKEVDKIGRGVARQYGKGDSGFNVSSCQFAIHYFFENPDTLKGFLKNVAETTKLNGYFIGTSYDGKTVFNDLKKVKTGESIQIVDDGKKIWEIIKGYGSESFDDDSSCIGYRIDVYQESINQYISEFLVNYDYLNRLMESYGFKIISREEANEMDLPEGSGLFSDLFMNMLEEIKRNKFKESLYSEAAHMTSFEKKISFMNRYFVYKKVREVNIDKLQLDLGEYEEAITQREHMDTQKAIIVAEKEEKKLEKPKVRKLSKKLLLIPATEATDDPIIDVKESKIKDDEKLFIKKVQKTTKTKFVIEDDEDDK